MDHEISKDTNPLRFTLDSVWFIGNLRGERNHPPTTAISKTPLLLWAFVTLFLFSCLAACSPILDQGPQENLIESQSRVEATNTPVDEKSSDHFLNDSTPTPDPVDQHETESRHPTVWVSPAVPTRLLSGLSWGGNSTPVFDVSDANFNLVVLPDGEAAQFETVDWLYVLVAPFPTLLDDIELYDLQAAWRGAPPQGLSEQPIFLEDSTRLAFQSVWGPPDSKSVRVVPAADLLEMTWENHPSFALVPFEMLDPRWKIIRINGSSPLDSQMMIDEYPLRLRFGLRSASNFESGTMFNTDGAFLPETNFDPKRMTTLIMTGVTALARSTALRMEEEGVLYPAQDIGELLRSADLTHISNEVPFFEGCPPAKPLRAGMRFCSDPRYIELLQAVGANVIELTGNHLLDWGREGMTATLDLYREHDMAYFGGGYHLDDARKPLLIEHNGNRLAFLGCNAIGPEAVFATPDSPGAAPCDREWMVEMIRSLVAQGYLPVVTFQSIELDDPYPHSMQRADFNQMAQAGAVIVSGSQAHIPQAMAFVEDRFIHYGLGNLFFDQMEPWQRPQFIDRHVFYEGRYIHTELITTMLEDSARPRLMDSVERQTLLMRIFEISGW